MNRKTALITGASRGIGKALALKLAGEGYQLSVICQKHPEELQKVKEACIKAGQDCLCFQGDVGDFSFIKETIQQTCTYFSTIDLLINNAGISYVGLLTDMSPEQWEQLLSTNLTALYNTCHEVIPRMVQQKSGQIINISSIWGNVGASCEVAYSATKGGVNSFTKALAKELAPSNISVNAISCGVIDTQMNQFLSPEERTALEEEIPAGRFGTTEEVADLAYALTTTSSYLTGQIITLDGGLL